MGLSHALYYFVFDDDLSFSTSFHSVRSIVIANIRDPKRLVYYGTEHTSEYYFFSTGTGNPRPLTFRLPRTPYGGLNLLVYDTGTPHRLHREHPHSIEINIKNAVM